MIEWLRDHVWWLTLMSTTLFVCSLGIGLAIMICMPADYFARPRRRPGLAQHRHPLLRITWRILKNLAGAIVLILGVIMTVPLVPGPGVLIIVLGLSLLDVPGKFAVEQYLFRRPMVLRSVNMLRARWNRPALIMA